MKSPPQAPPASEGLRDRTISDFGEQWTHYTENPGYYGDSTLLSDICYPFIRLEEFRGKRIADIGAGTGRFTGLLVEAGAERVLAVEPSKAFEVLKKNNARYKDKVTFLQTRGDEIARDSSLDYVLSIGVIHHIPDPDPVLAAAYHALKPGGKLLIWIYGKEGNELYVAAWTLMHAVTRRLPHWMLVGLTYALLPALETYIAACRILPLPMRDYMRNQLGRFPRPVRLMTIYDQLNPAYAKYYAEREAIALVQRAGFANVRAHHRHGYSWTVVGERR